MLINSPFYPRRREARPIPLHFGVPVKAESKDDSSRWVFCLHVSLYRSMYMQRRGRKTTRLPLTLIMCICLWIDKAEIVDMDILEKTCSIVVKKSVTWCSKKSTDIWADVHCWYTTIQLSSQNNRHKLSNELDAHPESQALREEVWEWSWWR